MGRGRGIVGEYLAYLRELGERPDYAFGRVAPDGSVTWYDFAHEDHDGAAGFTEHLLQLGYTIDATPPSVKFAKPRGWAKFRAMLKQPMKGVQYVPWKDYDATVPPPAPRTPVMVLTVDQTRKLNDAAKAQGVSLNSILLHALNDAVTPLMAHAELPRQWLIPVSIRGAAPEFTGPGNHVSFIGCRIPDGESVQDVHAFIRNQLATNMQWANLWQIKLLLRMGRKVTLHLLRKARAQQRYWTGNFSNMGPWCPSGIPESERDVVWCAAPPGFSEVAISSVVIVWCGRVSATLMVHPAIADSAAKAQGIIDRWRAKLLAASSSTSSP